MARKIVYDRLVPLRQRDWLPEDIKYEGTVEFEGRSPVSYEIMQTIRRRETALTNDKVEAIITADAAS